MYFLRVTLRETTYAPVPKPGLAEVAVCEERVRNPASRVHIVCREVHNDTYPREKLQAHTHDARGNSMRCTNMATALDRPRLASANESVGNTC